MIGGVSHIGQGDGLADAVQGDGKALALEVIFGVGLFHQLGGVQLDGGVVFGFVLVQLEHFAQSAGGVADVYAVAGVPLVGEGDLPVLADRDADGLVRRIAAAADGDVLLLQLVVDGLFQGCGVKGAVVRPEKLLLVEVDGDFLVAVGDGERAFQIAGLHFLSEVEGRAAGEGVAADGGELLAVGGVGRRGGQLLDGVQDDVAAALARGGHKVRVIALGSGEDGAVEKAGAGQVGARGIEVRGIIALKLQQLVGDALIRLLLPLEGGVFFLEILDFLLIALDHAGDQLFGIQAAGQARDDIIGPVSVDAGAGAGAGQTVDRCHKVHFLSESKKRSGSI